ncbi:MAG: cytochrome c nitrite reductase small subunit [Bacteroidales bacterium]|nr:cytochrome c nitrite reductase small subunit [Bacteroidales bacterium]
MIEFIKKLKPPASWHMVVIILIGIIVGLSFYSVYVSKAWSYILDEPKACVNCHIMAPQYATWTHSSHRETTTCNDCHVPHDNVARKYYFKAKDGLNHASKFTMRAERQVIFIGEAGKEVVKENCVRCHVDLFDQAKLVSQTKGKFTPHNTDRECWECHREVPHGRVNSLSSVPNSRVPVPQSPVPDWLKKITKE